MPVARDLDARGKPGQIRMRHRQLREQVVAPAGPWTVEQQAAAVGSVVAGRLSFAHADWSGYSIFEEAFTRGHVAGTSAASLGEDGMLLAARAADGALFAVHARLPRPLRGNATGAGDAAVAALAHALARGERDLGAIARSAVGISAAAVLMPYAGEVSASHAALTAAVVIEPVRLADREEVSP